MDCRIINEQTLPQVATLWDYCFEKKDTFFFKWYIKEYCLHQNMIVGGFDAAGQLLAMLHMNPYEINLRNQTLKIPYLVGVATAPVARGQGAFGKLIETAFTILRAKKLPFALLMPLSAGVYLPYEFAYTHYKHEYNLPLQELVLPKDNVDLILTMPEVIDEDLDIASVYQKATENKNAYLVRDARVWHNILTVFMAEGGKLVLVKDNEKILGYMLYSIEGDTFKILELISLNNLAKMKLLHFARQHLAQCANLNWLADADDLTYLNFKNQHFTGKKTPFMMARVIDIKRALALLPIKDTTLKGTMTVLFTDKIINLNTMLVKITIAGGEMVLTNTAATPDVIMDSAAFTQLYFGTFTVSELEAVGRIAVNNVEAGSLLNSLFPKCNNFINEYY